MICLKQTALVVGLIGCCLAGAFACSGSQATTPGAAAPPNDLPDAGKHFSDDDAETVDREVCVDEWPLANTLADAKRIDVLAERCRQQAFASERKLAAALDEAVAAGSEGSGGEGAGGAAGDDSSGVDSAIAKLREAREHLARATRGANEAEQRRNLIDDRLFEARLWRLGLGVHAGAAAAAGDRSFSRWGGNAFVRIDPTYELNFSITRDRVAGLSLAEETRWSGRVITLIGRGGVAFALGLGAGLHAPKDRQLPLIGLLGLNFRPFPHLGCKSVLPITDISLFAEHWHLNGDELETSPPDSPVFFGLSLTLGGGGGRVGDSHYLKLDGTTTACP